MNFSLTYENFIVQSTFPFIEFKVSSIFMFLHCWRHYHWLYAVIQSEKEKKEKEC